MAGGKACMYVYQGPPTYMRRKRTHLLRIRIELELVVSHLVVRELLVVD